MMMTGKTTTATQRSKRMPSSANVRAWPLALVSCASVAIVKAAYEQSHESGLLFKLDAGRDGALCARRGNFIKRSLLSCPFIMRLLSGLDDNGQNQDRLQHEGELVN